MLIDRADRVMNLCEMKYSTSRYEVSKDYSEWLKERREIFRKDTGTNKTLHLTLVSPYGVVSGKNTSILQNVITMDDLFERWRKGKIYYILIINEYLPRVKDYNMFGDFCQWIGIEHCKPIFNMTDRKYIWIFENQICIAHIPVYVRFPFC